MALLLLTILITILGSAFFCGLEAALFSVPLSRARVLLEQKRIGAASLVQIKERMSRPITVVVILGNVFSIAGSLTIGAIASDVLDNVRLGWATAGITFLITVFGEIVPKSIGENKAQVVSLIAARPLLFVTKIFSPLIWAIEKFTKPFTKTQKIVSEEEIRILSHLGHLEGSIEQDEKEMIHQVFKLNDLKASDIMTPSEKVTILDGSHTLEAVQGLIYSINHTRIPLHEGDPGQITGIVHQRELLISLGKDEKQHQIFKFKKEVPVVPQDTRADALITLFKKEKAHIAVVVDKDGRSIGIVTMEDIGDELIGEVI